MGNKVITAITVVALTVLVTFTITYSFFSPFIVEFNASLIDMSTGKLIINYEDKNPDIDFNDSIPGAVESTSDAVLVKEFTITGINTTGNDVYESLKSNYKISLVIDENNFQDNDLGYIFVGNNLYNNGNLVDGSNSEFSVDNLKLLSSGSQNVDLGTGYFDRTPESGVKHKYMLYLFYIDTGLPQDNYGSVFNGHILIEAAE